MHILGTILRFLFAWIDGIVAKVLTIVYDLLMQLANLTLYSESIVKVVGQRIGILLGIFMLFRLAVSLINYMISPEKFSDSKQGGAALVKNVIFSLILLATVNTIFETAYSVQKKIVESKIIEKIFFGETSNADMDIGYYLYTGFFTPNLDVASTCAEVWNPSIDLANSECNEELGGLLETNELNTVMEARNNLDMSVVFSNYDLVTANKGGVLKGQWIFEYTPIVSTAAGVVCLLILISFSMELAKRAIKLLFLQIVAPVPIIFNMDTGKGKDVFQKWYKECFNTYISVFIRLLAIDFGVFMIVILKSEFSKIFQDSVGVNIFIIIGCLMFAKEVPKLIENMFGIKMDGMTLRPLKKFQDQALFGKQITGLAGAGVASAAALGTNVLATKGGLFKRLGSGIGGAGSAFARGTVGALKGQTFGQTYKGAYHGAMTARTNRDDRQELGIKPTDVWAENIRKSMHISNNSQKYESELKHLDDYVSAGTAAKQRAEGEIDKKADMIKYNGQSLGSLRDAYEMLKNAQPDIKDSQNAISMSDIAAQTTREAGETDQQFNDRVKGIWQKKVNEHFQHSAEEMAKAASDAHSKYFKARKAITNAYISHGDNLDHNTIDVDDNTKIEGFHDAFGSAPRDEIVESNLHKMETLNDSYNMGKPVNRKDLGNSIQKAEDRRTEIRGSDEYGRAQLIQQQAAKEKK